MKIRFGIFLTVLLVLVGPEGEVMAQTYFKVLSDSHLRFKQKIDRFANGDVLIGDSSLESLNNGGVDGKIFLSRLDPCGNIVWSYGYNLPPGYLRLNDLKINAAGDIFAYGSFYRGLQERIFLIKVNGTTGESGVYQIFSPGTVDHFSYAIDLRDGVVMIYGLLLDFNTQKQGFVATFNESLTFQWARKFAPFESSGDAMITPDGEFICRSDVFLIKLDATGDLAWASVLESADNVRPIGGPIIVPGGYILEGHQEGMSFFYKIGPAGELIWRTELFPATNSGAAISLMDDGSAICTYSCPEGEINRLCQVRLSANGMLSAQRRLSFSSTFNNGNIYQTLAADEQTLTIVGNANEFASQPVDVADFVLQFALDDATDNCIVWEDFAETFHNHTNPTLTFYDFVPEPFDMTLDESIRTDTASFALQLVDICTETIHPDLLKQDTLLPCGEAWNVTLPTEDFVWTDGTVGQSRILSTPGIYRARSISCTQPVTIEYTLDQEVCDCEVFLPNAFSPNADGINDRLELFSSCALDEVEFIVFSRWGDQVFQSTVPDQAWDGTQRGQPLSTGVYVAYIRYRWTDTKGNAHEGTIARDVMLLR